MGKRKSIGRDPLDWIGEPRGQSDSPDRTGEAGQDGNGQYGAGDAAGPHSAATPAVLPLAPAAPELQLERQLLLVDGILRDGPPRPRLNQLLWTFLVVVIFTGVSVVLFSEARRGWSEKAAVLDRTIDRLEKEKGRNERMLEGLIHEKDKVIREKQGTIAKIEAVHRDAVDELRLARSETRRLQSENQNLVARLLSPSDSPPPAGTEAVGGPASGKAAPTRLEPELERAAGPTDGEPAGAKGEDQ